jgi:hypothetical protein
VKAVNYHRNLRSSTGQKGMEQSRMPPVGARWRHPAFQKRYALPPEERRSPFRALCTSGTLHVLSREELAGLRGGGLTSCSGKFFRCADLEKDDMGRPRCGYYGDRLRRSNWKTCYRCDECKALAGK